MPIRMIDDGYWNDPPIEPLSFFGKGLYLYLKYNRHCNQAGIYKITLRTIANETGLAPGTIRETFDELGPLVLWWEDLNLLWVKAFLKEQSRSPKFLTAAAKCLDGLPDQIIAAFLDHNKDLAIPYRYPIDTLSIPSVQEKTASVSATVSSPGKERGDSKGEETDPDMAAIARLYEENIGMITPVTADKLRDIRDNYPVAWFKTAVQEAVNYNSRSLAYIESILKRYKTDGPGPKKPRADKNNAPQSKIRGIKTNE